MVGVAALDPPAETVSIYYDVWGIQPYSQGRPRGRVRQPHAGRRESHAVRAFFAAGLREAIVFSTKSMTALAEFSKMSLRCGTLRRSVKAFSGGTDLASSPSAALIAAGNLPWWAQARQMTGPAPN